MANPSNRALVEAMNLPRHEACFTQNGGKRALRTSTKWQQAAAAVGRSKADGKQAYDGANGHYESSHATLEALFSAMASKLLARLAAEMDGLMQQWRAYKRSAALLDFDDLLYTARDLLAGHEEIRQALARRFRHVLVDEFQIPTRCRSRSFGFCAVKHASVPKQICWAEDCVPMHCFWSAIPSRRSTDSAVPT
jgi:ATP-dependent helicase/nuclease subunit A